MAMGRCAGCGESSGSTAKIRRHVLQCPRFAELYAQDPAKALDPTEEFERWNREENNDDAKLAARDARLTGIFADLEANREKSVARWVKPKDPLADDEDDVDPAAPNEGTR